LVNIWVAGSDADNNGSNSNSATFRIGIPVPSNLPVISSFSPSSATYLGPDFTLTVNGANFDRAALIRWSGSIIPTIYVSSSQLTATISTAQLSQCCIENLSVVNPGAESDGPWFPLTPPPSATLALSPESASAIAGGLLLTVKGYGFGPASQVLWNNTALVTTFVDTSQLTATVPASQLTGVSSARISVVTAGYKTGWLPLTITGPAIYTAGVVNGASSTPPVSPGSLISIYGSDLATGTATAAGTPLPPSLGGTSVTINGLAAPLLFVSPSQINAQVPYEVGPGTAAVVVRAGNISSSPAQVAVAATAPGIYTLGLTDHVIAVNLPEGTLNSPAFPAAPGQYVTLYLTGQGAVTPTIATGAAAPSSDFSIPLAATNVTIDSGPAGVQFAGLAPGFVGVMQVNLLISEIADGEHRLQVRVVGIKSNEVAISVKKRAGN
jgi:uncharacterized protein (TIGR03437 family)